MLWRARRNGLRDLSRLSAIARAEVRKGHCLSFGADGSRRSHNRPWDGRASHLGGFDRVRNVLRRGVSASRASSDRDRAGAVVGAWYEGRIDGSLVDCDCP